MKKNLLVTILVVSIITIVSCTSKHEKIESGLIGTWQIEDITYTLDENAMVTAESLDQLIEQQKAVIWNFDTDSFIEISLTVGEKTYSQEGKWYVAADNEKIVCTFPSTGAQEKNINLSKDKLTLTENIDNIGVLKTFLIKQK